MSLPQRDVPLYSDLTEYQRRAVDAKMSWRVWILYAIGWACVGISFIPNDSNARASWRLIGYCVAGKAMYELSFVRLRSIMLLALGWSFYGLSYADEDRFSRDGAFYFRPISWMIIALLWAEGIKNIALRRVVRAVVNDPQYGPGSEAGVAPVSYQANQYVPPAHAQTHPSAPTEQY